MNSEYQYDLVIAGGGTAGSFCAIAAARSGLSTAIVEKNTYLGGMMTGAGLTEMNAAGFQGNPLYQGIEKEVFDELIALGAAEYHFGVAMSSDKNVKVDRLRYNPEVLKIILEQKAVEAGVTLFYESEIETASETANGCTLQMRNEFGTATLHSFYLADATGNANLIRRMGGRTIKTPGNKQLTSSLMFRLSHVDLDKLKAFIQEDKIPAVIQKGYTAGILKGKILAFTPIPGTNDVSLNVTRANGDCEDTTEYSQCLVETRRQILPICAFLKKEVPGLEHAYLSNVAPFLGVRDGRRIEGEYMLTIQDLESMQEFPDSVAVGCYPMDLHDPVTHSVIWKVMPGIYHIPFRSLIPKGFCRTLVIGKCLCADKKAFGAIRVMPIMINTGESAGYLFALAKEKQIAVNALSNDAIAGYLKEQYER